MKRILFVVTLVVCLSMLFSMATADSMMYAINDDVSGVNLRDAPQGAKKGGIPSRECFLATKYNDDWAVVSYNGKTGYVYMDNIHVAHAEELEAWEMRKKQHITVTNEDAILVGNALKDCKVYKTANGNRLGSYVAGATVYIRALNKYWVKIIWKNREIGFVQRKDINLVDANIPGDGEVRLLKDKKGRYTKFDLRAEPTKDSESKRVLRAGTYVRVIGEPTNGFVKVACNYNGDVGYIREEYLRKVNIFNKK